MPTIFEDKSGHVIRTRGGSATKALLRVTGKVGDKEDALSSYDTIFVTAISIKRGTNNNVAYSLDNHIFLSAAGDRLGTLTLHGMVFGSTCGVTTYYANYGESHGGLHELMDFYKEHRLLGSKDIMPKIELAYTDQSSWARYVGYVTGVSTNTSDAASAAMSFTLDCLLVP